jgi:hypothetical protein
MRFGVDFQRPAATRKHAQGVTELLLERAALIFGDADCGRSQHRSQHRAQSGLMLPPDSHVHSEWSWGAPGGSMERLPLALPGRSTGFKHCSLRKDSAPTSSL